MAATTPAFSKFPIPTPGRLLLRREEPLNMTKGGLHLPDTAKGKSAWAEVLAVGGPRKLRDGTHEESFIKLGYRVLFSKYAGSEVDVNGEALMFLDQNEILAYESSGPPGEMERRETKR